MFVLKSSVPGCDTIAVQLKMTRMFHIMSRFGYIAASIDDFLTLKSITAFHGDVIDYSLGYYKSEVRNATISDALNFFW